MSKIKDDAWNLVSETIDLFPCKVDVHLNADKIFLSFENGHECLIRLNSDKQNQTPLLELSKIDEYELADEIERAIRNGNNEIFLVA